MNCCTVELTNKLMFLSFRLILFLQLFDVCFREAKWFNKNSLHNTYVFKSTRIN